MAILAECPIWHRKQAVKNKICVCGQDLDKAKQSKRVRYWIDYRLPGGDHRKEFVSCSIEEARDAEAKPRTQKRELGKRYFAKFEEDKSTFGDLSDWYLSLSAVQKRRTHNRIEGCLANVRKALGDRIVSTIKPLDLEEYQETRKCRERHGRRERPTGGMKGQNLGKRGSGQEFSQSWSQKVHSPTSPLFFPPWITQELMIS